MSGRVLLMFVFFFQALYAENGGLHQIFTKPSFFGVVTGTRSPRRPHASHVAHPAVPAAALSLLSLSALVCVGFKTEVMMGRLGRRAPARAAAHHLTTPPSSPRASSSPPPPPSAVVGAHPHRHVGRLEHLDVRLAAACLPVCRRCLRRARASVQPVSLLAARRRLRRRYPFWSVHERLYDFYKYYFFQTLSVMGARPPAARRPQLAARRAARIAARPPVDPRASRAAAPSAAGDGRLDAAGAPRARRHLARPGRQKVDLRRELYC